jgi:photosystem II stability/assembly factor-like uncharacterized protein
MKRSLALLPALLLAAALAPADQTAPWGTILDHLKPRSLGPTNMGGRIMDIAVFEKSPRIFYAATASGGLWKTVNGGTTFNPVFDRESTVSLGAVAVSQRNPDLVWIGTGEDSSRNSTAWGDGVYKSTDGGRTWQNVGLRETRHIGKIVIDPRNEDVVYVAAVGRLWGPNPERGVFKTTDGGRSWQHVMKLDDRTGAIDLVMDPKNPNTLVAAMWQRERKAYDFTSGGPNSGIYKTTDAGRTWRRITKGMPEGNLGRIGLDYFRANPKIMVATIEHRERAGENREQVRMNGGSVFRSTDGGESWTQMAKLNPRPFYFSNPVQDPVDENRVYLAAVSVHISDDKGATFRNMRSTMHPDFHAFWINPTDNHHMIAGHDGGIGQTRDRGEAWDHLNNMPLGQFYAITHDMRRPYWVYGGLQDNGSWGIPTQTPRGGVKYWHSVGVGGGDGFHVQVDPTDHTILYSESQGGAIMRRNLRTGEVRSIRPRAPQGETYRFNWSSPILISPHNPRTVYFGGNKLFKSVDRGDNWRVISPDLTTNDPEKTKRPGQNSVTPEDTGAERHCTIITISESPRQAGLLAVGTDDGLVQVSRDGGANWENVAPNIPGLPANTWCSRVLFSKHAEGRLYATFDGHRSDDFKAYAYVSEDYGQNWTKLSNDLPDYDCLYVIREGERNPDLLFLGSEMGLRVSLDRGRTWERFRTDFPTVAVHDLVIHPRELDLIIGTHGRSIWTLDVSGLEGLTSESRDAEAALFAPQDVLLLGRNDPRSWEGDRIYVSRNTQPGTRIQYHLKGAPEGDVTLVVEDVAGRFRRELTATKHAGLNVVPWDGRLGRPGTQGGPVLAPAGEYRVTLTVGEKSYTTSVRIEEAFLLD